jgi:cytochrome c-type biogenesis protein CcmH
MSEGGSIEEWTQLVRSRLVLGERDLAQTAYDAAVKAYPDPAMRVALDALARDENLVVAS